MLKMKIDRNFCKLLAPLVPEVTHTRKYHCYPKTIAGINRFLITERTSGLHNGCDAGCGGFFN
jgi:hypothetical protein